MQKSLRSMVRKRSSSILNNPLLMARKSLMTTNSRSKTKKFRASVVPKIAGNISINEATVFTSHILSIFVAFHAVYHKFNLPFLISSNQI